MATNDAESRDCTTSRATSLREGGPGEAANPATCNASAATTNPATPGDRQASQPTSTATQQPTEASIIANGITRPSDWLFRVIFPVILGASAIHTLISANPTITHSLNSWIQWLALMAFMLREIIRTAKDTFTNR